MTALKRRRRDEVDHAPSDASLTAIDTPVLWSTFQRGENSLCCTLGLTSDGAVYELRVERSDLPTVSVERFEDATAAFQRQAALERSLLDDGWTLERFEARRLQSQ